MTLIAIGNRNMGDDGIGLYILESIQAKLSDDIDVQLWENKDALSIAAELLEIQTPMVIVDCADMGLNGGDYRWFKASECQLMQHLNSLSSHGLGFADAFALAETLGFNQTVFFFAIQPVQLGFYSELSSSLGKKKESISAALVRQLQQLHQQLHSGLAESEKVMKKS